MIKSSRSQSEIISSLLLILLVIAAAAIIMAVVIPLIQDKMKADCMDVSGKITISDGYTCYNNDITPAEVQVQIHVDKVRDLISGYAVEVGGANTKSYEITNGTILTNVSMCDGSASMDIANNSEERTYRILSADKPSSIRVYPILKDGRLCELSDSSVDVQECIISSRKCVP